MFGASGTPWGGGGATAITFVEPNIATAAIRPIRQILSILMGNSFS